MGSAGRYSDRFFGDQPYDEPAATTQPSAAGIAREDVVALGATADAPRSPWRRRALAAIAVAGAAGAVLATVTNDDEPPPSPPAAHIPSRSGIETVPVVATSATSSVWVTRGYTYNVDLTNETSSPLDLIDVTTTNAGTELIWNQPVTLPPSGSAHLRVDFLVINCAAVAVAPAPSELRLTVRRSGTTEIPGVANVSVSDASQAVDQSTASLCMAAQ